MPTVTLEMNLQDLFERVSDSKHVQSRLKDVKTAVRVLARALGYPSPDTCPPTAYTIPLTQIFQKVDLLQTEKGEHTRRNTRNNLNAFFRAAEERNLLVLNKDPEQGSTLKPQYNPNTRPRRNGSTKVKRYHLPLDRWPQRLVQEYQQLVEWATAPMVAGRHIKHKKRQSTMGSYQRSFEAYFGYLHHECEMPLDNLQLELLFKPDSVRRFVYWHANELHNRITGFIHKFLGQIMALLNQYAPDQAALEQIKVLVNELDDPETVFDKQEVWVPLAQLEEIGQALWPTRKPRGGTNGQVFARRAGMSLMLRLWVRRPYRQRNIREMELEENLYKTAEGLWMVRFKGEELKVAKKKGKVNHFELPFPEDLVPDLEAFLSFWRPRLIQAQSRPLENVFLSARGTPFSEHTLTQAVVQCVYRYTQKALHPHVIRTIWTTEYLKDTHDLYGAAVMLNDTIQTVVTKYAHLADQGISLKADRWVTAQLKPKPTPEGAPNADILQVTEKLLSMLTKDHKQAALLTQQPELHQKLSAAIAKIANADLTDQGIALPEFPSPPPSAR